MSAGEVKYLETEGFLQAETTISDTITKFNEQVTKMRNTTTTLLGTWAGDGRVEFDTQTTLIMGKLGDISDELYDLYNALVEAHQAYIDADEAAAKAESIEGK